MKYKPVIGLEIHAELNTRTKMFCDSLNDPDEKHPNTNICPICMGHPGTLPVANIEAIKKVITAGLALNCKIENETFFERKNYFYPDLPKGYQISQYQKPLCYGGWLNIKNEALNSNNKKIRITRIHLEEDAGRLYHLPADGNAEDYSLVDYNRAGVPLMELVTEPDFETGKEVKDFAQELQLILKYLNISDADMEKGLMRVEVNISLASPTGEWGTKVEIKNLNSIKAAADSVDYEIKRQTEVLEDGEKVKQETRGWDENKKATFSQRSKEEAHDYRYFPEPDLPPIRVLNSKSEILNPDQGALVVEELKDLLLELPQQRRERFKNLYLLPEHDIEVFVVNKNLGNFFEHVASELDSFENLKHLKQPSAEHRSKILKLAANYLITEYARMCQEISADPEDTKITPELFSDMIVRIFHKEVSSSGAQVLIKEMFATGEKPEAIVKKLDIGQVSDSSELEIVVGQVLLDNSKAVQDFKSGKEASLKFLIGMVMRESKGKANPQVAEDLIRQLAEKIEN